MPYPSEHSARITDPDKYDDFRRQDNSDESFKDLPDGVSVILGIKDDKSEVQAYRFKAESWTVEKSKKWLEENEIDYIKFEPAAGAEDMNSKKYECECLDCGHVMSSDEHCRNIKCPECGGEMRRKERPGPGNMQPSRNLKMLKLAATSDWLHVNLDADTPEILIYDVIGTGMFDDGVSPEKFRNALKEVEKKSDHMNLRINSPGGFIHDGFTIYNALRESNLHIDAYIDGLAASCASWIPMACDTVKMAVNSEIMIHDAWGIVIGTAGEMRSEADHLDSLENLIVKMYAKRTGKNEASIRRMMSKVTWMTGAEAVEMGFADELLEESKAAACAFDLDEDILPNLPSSFRAYQAALKKRAREQSLRDAGYSRAVAARRATQPENRLPIDSAEIRSQINKAFKMEIDKCLTMTK